MSVQVVSAVPLTPAERDRLAELEAVVTRGLQGAIQLWKALTVLEAIAVAIKGPIGLLRFIQMPTREIAGDDEAERIVALRPSHVLDLCLFRPGSQLVDERDNVYVSPDGENVVFVGKRTPSRPRWTTWGLEAAGEPKADS